MLLRDAQALLVYADQLELSMFNAATRKLIIQVGLALWGSWGE